MMKKLALRLLSALEEPIRQIAENAGLDGVVIADKAKMKRKVLDLMLLR